jgi:hypothetical protein
MDHVILIIRYDPSLVSPEFMAEHITELEGVDTIKIKEGD